MYGVRAVVVMAENATPSKVDATRSYGAEVVLHGSIWDEANVRALDIAHEQGLTYIHPFDDLDLIAGQGTLAVELWEDLPTVDVVLVPIGGGGLISGVAQALKLRSPSIRIIGVESEGAPAMQRSVQAQRRITLDTVDCSIDGLRVKEVGEHTLALVLKYVDDIVTLPDSEIYDAMIWTMQHAKLVVEGAAAAPVAALLHGLVEAPTGTNVVCVLSGGNVDLGQLRGRIWN
jgi:threonine dehydratase